MSLIRVVALWRDMSLIRVIALWQEMSLIRVIALWQNIFPIHNVIQEEEQNVTECCYECMYSIFKQIVHPVTICKFEYHYCILIWQILKELLSFLKFNILSKRFHPQTFYILDKNWNVLKLSRRRCREYE